MTEVVKRTGLVFRCGEYPDKDFSLTAEEARAAIAAFKPVPVDLEHTSTVLDGRLGTLESVEMGPDGETIMGSVALPTWLDALLDEGQRKVSATWDRATKQLRGLAIVNTPRVSDAVLMAAFTATDEGKRLVSVEADFTNGGARAPEQARERAKEQGMTTPTAPTTPSRMERFFRWMAGEGDDAQFSGGETPKAAAAPPAQAAGESEEVKALKARIAALEGTAAAAANENAAAAATAFADGEIAAGRAFTAERDALIAAFKEAAEDDRTAPRTVTFADAEGKEASGSRVDALRARHAARSPHGLFQEAVQDAQVAANPPNTMAPVKMSDERKKRLMSYTGIQMTGGK